MTVTTYPARIFGGRNLTVVYDSAAGTLSIANVSLSLSSLSNTLQALWANAIATSPQPLGGRPAFGGDNIGQAVGSILDATPTWRTAIQAALANYVDETVE